MRSVDGRGRGWSAGEDVLWNVAELGEFAAVVFVGESLAESGFVVVELGFGEGCFLLDARDSGGRYCRWR